MKKIITLLLLAFWATSSYAQWETLNPKPSYASAKKVKFVTAQTGFIINGTELLQTTDAGITWAVKQSLAGGNDIKFINETGYIACDNGKIYKSTDSGETWNLLTTESTDNFTSVCIVDSDTVVIASAGSVYRSTNGGAAWTALAVPTTVAYFRQLTTMCFTSAQTGHIGTGTGTIYKTTDGGATWVIKQETNTGPSDYVTMYFVTANLGFATNGYDTVMRTADGGETWSPVADTDLTNLIYDIQFINTSTGYACAGMGVVYKTTDSGITWDMTFTPHYFQEYYPDLHGIAVTNGSLFTVGSNGFIGKSTDGGATFTRYSPTYSDISKVVFTDAATAYAHCGNKIYKSTDAGATWQALSLIVSDYSMHELQFVNPSTAYAIINNNVIKTTDGGLTWAFSQLSVGAIGCLTFIDANTGYISGGLYYTYFMKTTDGGATWQTVSNLFFTKIKFITASTGYAISRGPYSAGLVYKTIDGGTTWNVMYTAEDEINDFDFTDENAGYIAGRPGEQRKTSDGGATWQPIPSIYLDNSYISILRFADANNGYAITDYGEIYKTADAGENWTRDPASPQLTNDLSFYGGYTYLAGDGGKILRQPIGAALSAPQLTPKTEGLYVYPNPATAAFTLSAGSVAITSVQLYDIAGRRLTPKDINFTNNQATVTLPESANGIYIANVVLANGSRLSKKIVVN